MTTFNYTSGDPTHLVGGTAANMADISGPFADIKTFLNGGNLDATNLATSADPVTLLGQYRTVTSASSVLNDSNTSGVNFLGPALLSPSGTAGAGLATPGLVYLDGSDYTVSGLTAKLRVRGAIILNSTASLINYTFGLYPLTPSGGADTITLTAGTVTSGSTAAVNAPSNGVTTAAASSDFSVPTTGLYMLGVALSGSPTANATGYLYARLELRHV